jgi:hypothetical protein
LQNVTAANSFGQFSDSKIASSSINFPQITDCFIQSNNTLGVDKIVAQVPVLQDSDAMSMGVGGNKMYAQIKTIPQDASLVFVGDIHGDLDVLVQLIHDWQKAGILDKDYKIRDNTYLVFLGDYVDRGPASKAVLSLLFSLKCLNLDRCVLIRGNHDMVMKRGLGDWRGLQVYFDDANQAQMVSDYLVSELFLRTADGSIITASHANPPLWSQEFISKADSFVPSHRLEGLCKNAFLHAVEGWYLYSAIDSADAQTLKKYFDDNKMKLSFLGHHHPHHGYQLAKAEDLGDLKHRQQSMASTLQDQSTHYTCILRTQKGYDKKRHWAELTVGSTRKDWKLEIKSVATQLE